MTFKSLGLSAPLLQAVEDKGYTEPSQIQEKSIPLVLQGKDILASAQTGTGKTASFILPILQQLSNGPRHRNRPIRALVLTPTRELAAQIYDNAKHYSKHLKFSSAVIFGGVKQRSQEITLRQGVDLLIATPGRLLDLHDQKILSLHKIEIFVLDEADRMLDMGFRRDIDRIMNLLPKRRQSLLFSATFSKEIKTLAKSTLSNPISVEVTPENTTVERINQKVIFADKSDKTAIVQKLIQEGDWHQVLVFTRTKYGADRLTKKLIKNEISAAAIHGNKAQNNRIKSLSGFKNGSIRVLVATDIAARGIDIPLLPHVINFELPNVPEDYVHRIGRTGRAGASGEAISLVAQDEKDYLKGIQNLIGEVIPGGFMEGFEPKETSGPTKYAARKKTNSKKRKPNFRNSSSSSSSSKRNKGYRSKRRK